MHATKVDVLHDFHNLKKEVRDLKNVVRDHDNPLNTEHIKTKDLEEQLQALQCTHAASKRPRPDTAGPSSCTMAASQPRSPAPPPHR